MVGRFNSFTPSFFEITPSLLHFQLDIWNIWILSDLKIQSWIFLNKRTLSYQLQSISYFYFFTIEKQRAPNESTAINLLWMIT